MRLAARLGMIAMTAESERSFYRKPLPEPAIAFSSAEGLGLFREALAAGTMGVYFRLAETFHTQEEPAYCGLASLAMVLNALAVDPGRIWKGVWRWYGEGLLECCEPLEVVAKSGVTVDKLACTARCNAVEVETVFAPAAARVRAVARRVCSQEPSSPKEQLIAAYSRRELGQTGDGHFSPIGGYHEASDRVLILDVARFKYPAHWIPIDDLARAMAAVDPDSAKPRGLLSLRPSALKQPVQPALRLEFLDHATYLGDRRPPAPLADAVPRLPPPPDDDRLLPWAFAAVDTLVAAGALPRARVHDVACCSKVGCAQARADLDAAADAVLLDRSLAVLRPHEAVATLLALPDRFWTAARLLDPPRIRHLNHLLRALSPPALADDILDLRRKFLVYLDFALDDAESDAMTPPSSAATPDALPAPPPQVF